MSENSDSSNTVDHLAYIMPLYFIIADVLNDFDFSDIALDDIPNFLTKHEEKYILEETNRHCQIFRLFNILEKKPQSILKNFMDTIQGIYYWLKITKEQQLKERKTSHYAALFHELRTKVSPKYPDLYVRRVKPFLELRQILLQLQRHGKVALFSDFGFGKKWLAVDVCSDYQVMAAMDFKIYWIQLGQCKSNREDLLMLKYLYEMLKDPESRPQSPIDCNSIENSTDCTRFVSKDKLMILLKKEFERKENQNCLVVLEDIKITKQFYTFNLPCKLLVITRNKKIAEMLPEKSSFKVNLDRGLERSEFFFFMEKYVGAERENFPKNGQKEIANDIYNSSKGHPYLLSIVARSLQENPTSAELWNSWVQSLRNKKIHDNIKKDFEPIRKNLDTLEPALRDSLNQLIIFSHSEYVPVKLLKIFWEGRNAKKEIKKLYDHSFLEKMSSNKPHNTCETSYKLPFILIAYLRFVHGDDAVAQHKKVLDYYSVAECIENRSDIEMFTDTKHDFYFFLCLGHHLRGAKSLDLFPKIYFDFGFLQQKIRTVGFLKTIADLKYYEEEITGSDQRHRKFLEALRDFLQNLERTLFKSKDTCLLQCALMYTDELIHREALRQVQKFPDRLWLQENGYFRQYRQVIQLTSEVKHVTFLDAKFCLVFYVKGGAALIDTSLDGIIPEAVRDCKLKYDPAQVFLLNKKSMHLLMLGNNGDLMLWSDPLNEKYEQASIKSAIDTNIPDAVAAVYVDKESVLVAKKSGKLEELEWNESSGIFKQKQQPSLETRITNICFICIIFEYYTLVIDKNGEVSVWYVVDSSRVHLTTKSPISLENVVYQKVLQSGPKQKVLVVCEGKISLLLLEKIDTHHMKVQEEYDLPPQRSTSATLTTDENYLVLGTKCGLYIFDMRKRKAILGSNFYEEITDVDAHSLVDEIYKNIIACGSDKTVLNLFSLRRVGHGDNSRIQWAHFDNSEEHSEQGVWSKLFDATYKDGRTILMLVQTGIMNRICRIENHILVEVYKSASTITGVTICGQRAFAGNSKGKLIDISGGNSKNGNELFPISMGDNPIEYLQLLDENTLVASTKYKNTIISNHRDTNIPIYEGQVKYAFKMANGVLAILKKGELWCIWVLRFGPVEKNEVEVKEISCCDFKDHQLFTASKTNDIFLYTIRDITISSGKRLKAAQSRDISCLAISNSHSEFRLVATGGNDGVIKVYTYSTTKLNELKFLHTLKSHASQIFDMKFSPSGAALVSCSDTLCFWSVIDMLNHSLTEQKSPDKEKLTNSRYSSSSETQEVDATVFHSTSTFIGSSDKEPSWKDMKVMSSNRPMLACINFDGHQATKFCVNSSFTRFHIIDSEGVCYALTVNDFYQPQPNEYNPSLPHIFGTSRSYEQSENIGGTDI